MTYRVGDRVVFQGSEWTVTYVGQSRVSEDLARAISEEQTVPTGTPIA